MNTPLLFEIENDDIKMINVSMAGFHKEYLFKIQKDKESIFDFALRNNAVPPIKGEITKGKIRYRGIYIVVKNNFPDSPETWLEQRGKLISPIIKIELKLNPIPNEYK